MRCHLRCASAFKIPLKRIPAGAALLAALCTGGLAQDRYPRPASSEENTWYDYDDGRFDYYMGDVEQDSYSHSPVVYSWPDEKDVRDLLVYVPESDCVAFLEFRGIVPQDYSLPASGSVPAPMFPFADVDAHLNYRFPMPPRSPHEEEILRHYEVVTSGTLEFDVCDSLVFSPGIMTWYWGPWEPPPAQGLTIKVSLDGSNWDTLEEVHPPDPPQIWKHVTCQLPPIWSPSLFIAFRGRGLIGLADLHVALELAPPAVPRATYLPFAIGNSWTYEGTFSGGDPITFSIVDTKEIEGKEFYLFDRYFSYFDGHSQRENVLLRYDKLQNKIFEYVGNKERGVYDFSRGRWTRNGFPSSISTLGSCKVGAGTFQECVQARCGENFGWEEILSPNVGCIAYRFEDFTGQVSEASLRSCFLSKMISVSCGDGAGVTLEWKRFGSGAYSILYTDAFGSAGWSLLPGADAVNATSWRDDSAGARRFYRVISVEP